MDQYWIDKIFLLGAAALSGGALFKLVNSYIHRAKTKAETESVVASTYKVVLSDVMGQLAELRKENREQAKEIAQMKIDHRNEMDHEHKNCAQQLQLAFERIRDLEHRLVS